MRTVLCGDVRGVLPVRVYGVEGRALRGQESHAVDETYQPVVTFFKI
jgi:hypothetical protein